jgi:hypothetical protein
MAEKKAKKAADEAKENKANELLRRKAGQVRIPPTNNVALVTDIWTSMNPQDQTAAKEELKMKQLAKDQEAKRRGLSCALNHAFSPDTSASFA